MIAPDADPSTDGRSLNDEMIAPDAEPSTDGRSLND